MMNWMRFDSSHFYSSFFIIFHIYFPLSFLFIHISIKSMYEFHDYYHHYYLLPLIVTHIILWMSSSSINIYYWIKQTWWSSSIDEVANVIDSKTSAHLTFHSLKSQFLLFSVLTEIIAWVTNEQLNGAFYWLIWLQFVDSNQRFDWLKEFKTDRSLTVTHFWQIPVNSSCSKILISSNFFDDE